MCRFLILTKRVLRSSEVTQVAYKCYCGRPKYCPKIITSGVVGELNAPGFVRGTADSRVLSSGPLAIETGAGACKTTIKQHRIHVEIDPTKLLSSTSGFGLSKSWVKTSRGHDITAIFRAIKKSSALPAKSEFESTAAFDTKRAAFVDRQLYGTLKPSDYLGFVADDTPTEFKYDADSQILTVTLTDSPERFMLENDDYPTLDSVLVRRIVLSRDRYIGGNAFGAKVVVTRTNSQEYGVAFNQNNWLFPSSENYPPTFSYQFAIGPEEARATKANAKLLLVCRLSDPWLRRSAHGDNPTINSPTGKPTSRRKLPSKSVLSNCGCSIRKQARSFAKCPSRLLRAIRINNLR